jgi:hypothetical protein
MGSNGCPCRAHRCMHTSGGPNMHHVMRAQSTMGRDGRRMPTSRAGKAAQSSGCLMLTLVPLFGAALLKRRKNG